MGHPFSLRGTVHGGTERLARMRKLYHSPEQVRRQITPHDPSTSDPSLLGGLAPPFRVTRKSAAPPFAVFEGWEPPTRFSGGYRYKDSRSTELKILELKTSPCASVLGSHPLKGAKGGAPSAVAIQSRKGWASPPCIK